MVSQEIFLYVDIHLYFYVEILLAYICSIVCLPFLFTVFTVSALTLSRRKPLSYRNQSIDLQSKSMDWLLYDNGLRLERVKDGHL